MVIRPYVSSHAVVRFVQRIIGVTIDEPGDVTEAELAKLYAAAVERTVGDIAREILSPAVRVGILAGFPQVATRRFRALIAANGTVCTIRLPFPHTGGRLVAPTPAEAARKQRRANLRERSMAIVIERAISR